MCLVVTSPPYWQLKDYGTENQLGFYERYESYINNLNLVWNEEFFTVKEILSPKKVRLFNGLTVKLLGIKSEPFTHDKAVGYLTEKIKRMRIFYNTHKLKHDEENVRLFGEQDLCQMRI